MGQKSCDVCNNFTDYYYYNYYIFDSRLDNCEKVSIIASTQKSNLPQRFSPLENTCLSPIIQKSQHCPKFVKSPQEINITDKATSTSTPKRVLVDSSAKASSKKFETPKRCSSNVSVDEQWTDEELFEHDSFLLATQGIADLYKTPSPRNFKRRVATSTPVEKGHKTRKLDISPNAIDKGFEKELFKQPKPVAISSSEKCPPIKQVKSGNDSYLASNNKVSKYNLFETSQHIPKLNFPKYSESSSVKNNYHRFVTENITSSVTVSLAGCTETKVNSSVRSSLFIAPTNFNPVHSIASTKSGTCLKTKDHESVRKKGLYQSPLSKKDSNSEINHVSPKFNSKDACSKTNSTAITSKSSDFDISISEELLACLAEPDEMLDTHCHGAGYHTSEKKPNNCSNTAVKNEVSNTNQYCNDSAGLGSKHKNLMKETQCKSNHVTAGQEVLSVTKSTKQGSSKIQGLNATQKTDMMSAMPLTSSVKASAESSTSKPLIDTKQMLPCDSKAMTNMPSKPAEKSDILFFTEPALSVPKINAVKNVNETKPNTILVGPSNNISDFSIHVNVEVNSQSGANNFEDVSQSCYRNTVNSRVASKDMENKGGCF